MIYDYLSFRNIIIGIPITFFTTIVIGMINDYYIIKFKKNNYKKLD